MVRWGASQHISKAGSAGVRGGSPGRASGTVFCQRERVLRRCILRSRRDAVLRDRRRAQHAGEARAGDLRCSKLRTRAIIPGRTRNFFARASGFLWCSAPRKKPVPRPCPPEGLPARLQRPLRALLGLGCPMVVRGRRAPRRRKFPSRHASVPFREQCGARTIIRLGELAVRAWQKVAALLARCPPKPREDPW